MRKKGEDRLKRLNDCFLRFGPDPVQNINSLVRLCGELLVATSALYNRLNGGLLCSIGQWNTPEDFEEDEEGLTVYQHRFATRSFARHQEVELPLHGGKRILVEMSNSLLEIPNEPLLLP